MKNKINFLMELNKAGLVNLVSDGNSYGTKHEGASTTIDLNNSNSMSRVIDFKELFVDCKYDIGLVISKNDIMFEDGSSGPLSVLFKNFKKDNRPSHMIPKINDIVEIGLCTSGNAIISVNSAKPKSDFQTNRGIVKSIDSDGVFHVYVGKEIVRLPSICLEGINHLYGDEIIDMIVHISSRLSKRPVLLQEYNYMQISECGKFMEYIQESRLSRFKDDFWSEELRAKYATKKKIRGVISGMCNLSDSEMGTTLFMFGKSDMEVSILDGYDILDVFNEDNIVNSGSLGNSCMMGKDDSFFDVYVENARCAVVKNDDGKIVLRAMIWTLHNDNNSNTIEFLDRIYSADDSIIPMLQQWASKKGMYCLNSQNHSSTRFVSPNGEKEWTGDWHVRVTDNDYENYPYIDTYCYVVGKRLYACGAIKMAHNTDGDIDEI